MAKKNKPKIFLGEENLDKLGDDPSIALDLETTGLSPFRDRIAIYNMYSERTGNVVIVQTHGRACRATKKFIESREELLGHNLVGFDLPFMERAGIDTSRLRIYDSMLAEGAILTSDRRDISVNLKKTVGRRTGVKLSKSQDHSGWSNATLTESQIEYCAGDVKELPRLREAQRARADENQWNAVMVECDLVPAMVRMSLNGLPVDRPKLERMVAEQSKLRDKLDRELRRTLGDLNLGSPSQVKKALNAWLAEAGEDPLPGTSVQVLEDQARYGGEFGELCESIIEHRHAGKRSSMYSQKWMDRFIIEGRIHPHWWTTRTDTLRMSCSDPNLQQWPRDMRSAVGGVPGHKIVKCDLQQAEIRVAAAVANCPGLKRAFAEGLHVHTDIASRAFGIPYDEVATRKMPGFEGGYKQLGKALSFTMLFGGGISTFIMAARRAKIVLTEAQAQKIFEDFFRAYPGMQEMKRDAQARARRRVTVLTLPTGVKRVLAGPMNTPSRIMNTLIQGGAAAGLKFGMLEAHRRGLFEYVVAVVHDEMVACAPSKMAREVGQEMMESMNIGLEQVMDDVPSVAEVKTGDYWQ